MEETKFKVDNKVCSKATGLPASGTITHVLSFDEFIKDKDLYTNMSYDCTYRPLYPDWIKKPIYYVKFDKPQKNLTKEELKNSLPYKFHRYIGNLDELVDILYKDIKEVYFASYPEDDLELL